MLLSLDRLSINMYNNFWSSLISKYFIQPEQEKAPPRIFLKIGAWTNEYKKKVDDARVRTILAPLLTFKFETLANAEFIFDIIYKVNLASFI